MDKDIQRRRDAHVRASGVGAEYSAKFDASAGGQKARSSLDTAVVDEDHQIAERLQALEDRRSSTEMVRRSRLTLRELAKGILKVTPLVNVNGPLMDTLQRLGHVRNDGELLPYMRVLHDRVSAHADAFVAEGLPADQLQKLADEIDRFVAAKDLQTKAVQRAAAADEALRTSQETARKAIGALEAAAMGLRADHPEILTKLRLAMRVGPRAPSDATTASPPGKPTAPTPLASPPATPASPSTTTDKAA